MIGCFFFIYFPTVFFSYLYKYTCYIYTYIHIYIYLYIYPRLNQRFLKGREVAGDFAALFSLELHYFTGIMDEDYSKISTLPETNSSHLLKRPGPF